MEDTQRCEMSQQRTRCDTTAYSLLSSAYWYLMGGPGPSSNATSMKSCGTLSRSSCSFWKTHSAVENSSVPHGTIKTSCALLYKASLYTKMEKSWLHSTCIWENANITLLAESRYLFIICLRYKSQSLKVLQTWSDLYYASSIYRKSEVDETLI